MFIGTQYYRPPFPEKRFWDTDFAIIRDTGIDAVQLWVCWGWVESEPGIFKFDDYDELINKSQKYGLKIVISTIAEIHPYWIHRIVPDSYMIDHMGNKVISSNRCECNVGLTPGGCFDNPKVSELMGKFLETVAKRYSNEPNLIGWDCWNELRWNVNSDGFVCYCPSTIKKFREWLKEKYGDLDNLNTAWKRKYCSWDDVLPGKLPGRTYTELMEFARFITWRAGRHARFRYEKIREYDKKHIISAHCCDPCTMFYGFTKEEQPLDRGNDWDLVNQLDGFGISNFPLWLLKADEYLLGLRLQSIYSAVNNKVFWMSELQGGSARSGLDVTPSVSPQLQQLWVWNGISRGAKGVIFWCWRDEVFGRESAGFGIVGNDGYAKERLKFMNMTSKFLKKHGTLIDNYRPDEPEIGVLFEQDNYYLNWSNGNEPNLSLYGYLYALERLRIPYKVIESNHLDTNLNNIKLLIMPWPLIVNQQIIEPLKKYILNGGTILCEGELDAYDSLGFYRYPGNDRKFASIIGIKDIGRRMITQETISLEIDKKIFKVKPDGFLTPFDIKECGKKVNVLGKTKQDYIVAIEKKLGPGTIYALGMFLGNKYAHTPYIEFEKMLYQIITRTGWSPAIKIIPRTEFNKKQWEGGIQYRVGNSDNNKLLFITNYGKGTKVTVRTGTKNTSLEIEPYSWNVFRLKNGSFTRI